MRYYDLDTNGKVKGSYAVPQPDLTLVPLEGAPGNESMYVGGEWIPDQDIIDARLAIDAKAQEIIDNLPA